MDRFKKNHLLAKAGFLIPLMTLAFNMTSVAKAQTTGVIEICKASAAAPNNVTGTFTFTINTMPGQAFTAPVGFCTGPITLPIGANIITEVVPSGDLVVSVAASPVGSPFSTISGQNPTAGTATVQVVAGTISTETLITFTNRTVPTGFIEVCKASTGTPAVTGTFSFTVSGVSGTFTAPVGFCTGRITVPAGTVTVTEAAVTGVALDSCSALPSANLLSCNTSTQVATVTVAASATTATQTVLTFVNRVSTGALKVCKIAGTGVAVGTLFTFDVMVGTNPPFALTVQAGPASELGFCVLDGTIPIGSIVTVMERIPGGSAVSAINISGNLPSPAPSTNLSTGSATFAMGGAFTEVSFTDINVPPGTLKICKIAGSGVAVGTLFTFTVNGSVTYTIPAGPASEGGFCLVDGMFPGNSTVTVAETVPTGFAVSSITGCSQTGTNSCSVTIPPGGFGEASFTNTTVPATTCFSPGYFKNHLSSTQLSTSITSLGFTFTAHGDITGASSITIGAALAGGGGPGIAGAEKILLRAAVTAVLNGFTGAAAQVNTLLSSSTVTRKQILSLAATLESVCVETGS
jgi:hypothetical protein